MFRPIIPICLWLGLISTPLPSSGAVITPREEMPALINSISRVELEHHLRVLTGEDSFSSNGINAFIHSRNIFHPDIELAIEYISVHLENLGLEVETYPLPATAYGRSVTIKNILARIPGKTSPDRIYLLAGHYDSTASSSESGYDPYSDPAPGADDNGTAVSVLLTLAGALRQAEPETSIGFLFLSGEEYGLLGSRSQAESFALREENILGMINMDMLGPDPEAEARTLYAIYGDHLGDSVFNPEPLARVFYDVASVYDLPLKVESYYGPVIINSDQFFFWCWGYPAIFLSHINSSNEYHKPGDRIATVDLDYLEASARIIGAAAVHLAGPEPALIEKSGGCQAAPGVSSGNLFTILFPLIAIILLRFCLQKVTPKTQAKACGCRRITGIIFICLAIISCSGESKTDSLINQGKLALSQADQTAARDAFQEVLDSDPDNPEAQFGLVLADLTRFWGSINQALSEIFRLFLKPGMIPQSYANEDEAISAFLQKFITETRATFAGIAGRLEEVEKQENFNFRIESLPVGSLYNQSRSVQVEFDRTDLYLLSGSSRLMAFLFEFLDAFDWEGRYGQAVDLYFLPRPGFGEAFGFSNVVVFMLNDPLHPNLLDLKAGVGADTLTRSGQTLSAAYHDFRNLIESLSADTSGRDNNLVTLGNESGKKYIVFGGKEISRTSGAIHLLDLQIEFRPEIAAGLETAAQNLETGSGTISLKNDLLYLIDPVIRALVLIAGFNLPGFLDGIHISTLVPDVIELNLGRYFLQPAGLRQLLPPWTDTGNIFLDNFILEWECLSELDSISRFPRSLSGITCPDPAATVDAGHFSSLESEGIAGIPADGIESILPYIPFPDPTLNGLLYLNPEPLGISSPSGRDGFQPAENLALNAILSSLLGPILELF